MSNQLFLFTAHYPYGSGETFLETEIDYLAKKFVKVNIVALDQVKGKPRILPSNVNVHTLKPLTSTQKYRALIGVKNRIFLDEHKYWRKQSGRNLNRVEAKTALMSLYNAKRILRLLKNVDLSSTVFYSYWCNDAALALAILSLKKSAKTFSRVHGWDLYFEASSIGYLPYRKFIAENLTKIGPISTKGSSYIKDVWKADQTNIEVCRLGVYGAKENQLIRTNYLVSCSNIIPLKRVDLIADAVGLTKSKLNWHHFGAGVGEEQLQQRIRNGEIEGELHGYVTNQDIHKWYAENPPKLFVNLSTTEGIPVSIMEAMSFGIPVIATNVGGTSEIVNDKNGKLLDTNPSAQEVAEVIDYFYNLSEAEYKRYSEAAYSTWKEKYNAEKNYSEFANMLSRLLED